MSLPAPNFSPVEALIERCCQVTEVPLEEMGETRTPACLPKCEDTWIVLVFSFEILLAVMNVTEPSLISCPNLSIITAPLFLQYM